MNYIELTIDETFRNSRINTIKVQLNSYKDVKQYLIDRYGKLPGGKNKIFVDGLNNEAIQIGFTHTYWIAENANSKSALCTDWIQIMNVSKVPSSYNLIKKA